MSDVDDDLNAPLATDNLPPRDDSGRFTTPDPEPADERVSSTTEGQAADEAPAAAVDAEVPVGEDASSQPAAAEQQVAVEQVPVGDQPSEEDKLKNQKVPYSRFKEAVTKERQKREQLEQELTQLRERLQSRPEVDITEDELNSLGDALIEGKTADFAKGMKAALEKMFQKGVEVATERARDVTRIESAEERVVRERQEAAARWQAAYPQFDPQSEQFDEDMLDEAIALRDAYEARGMSPAAAIERAVLRVAGPQPAEAPAPAPAPPKRPSTVPQKLAAANAQPPLPSSAGEVDKPTSLLSRIAQMSDEEFDRLPEAEIEKLRRGVKL